jgi:hypothetical protein
MSSICETLNVTLTSEERELLKRSPLIVFLLVAGADHRIDKKEIDEFIQSLLFPHEFYSDLLVEAIDCLLPGPVTELDKSDPDALNEAVKNVTLHMSHIIHHDHDEHLVDLLKAKHVLDKLPPEHARDFKLSLFHIAHRIAESSGGFLGFGSKIDKWEKEALKKIVYTLDIEVSDANIGAT